MLIGIFGTPSPFTYWAKHALCVIADVSLSQYQYVETSSLSELRAAVSSRGDRAVVYFSDCPEAGVADVFLKSGAPFIACFENPADVLGYCVAARDMQTLDATRFTCQSLSALHDLFLARRVCRLHRAEVFDVEDYTKRVAGVFRMKVDGGRLDRIIERLAVPATGEKGVEASLRSLFPHALDPGEYAAKFEQGADEVFLTTVRQYAPVGEGLPIRKVRWAPELFFDAHAANGRVAARQDLIGKSRPLAFGPYLHLPRGRWTADVSFSVGENWSGNLLYVDVAVLGDAVAKCELPLPKAGTYQLGLEFEVFEPRSFLEVRVVMLQGAIEGWFSLHGVDLLRSDLSQARQRERVANVTERTLALARRSGDR